MALSGMDVPTNDQARALRTQSRWELSPHPAVDFCATILNPHTLLLHVLAEPKAVTCILLDSEKRAARREPGTCKGLMVGGWVGGASLKLLNLSRTKGIGVQERNPEERRESRFQVPSWVVGTGFWGDSRESWVFQAASVCPPPRSPGVCRCRVSGVFLFILVLKQQVAFYSPFRGANHQVSILLTPQWGLDFYT